MSVPEKLVKAAANALYAEKGYADWEYAAELARTTIAAAFAALPGCEEAVQSVAAALEPDLYDYDEAAEVALTGLARMAQP